jgi:hypothetical protein
MAGGGVIHTPNGPPIPLNVDFGAEVVLGHLLGRGGFGHVYEATWRGEKVRGVAGGGVCGASGCWVGCLCCGERHTASSCYKVWLLFVACRNTVAWLSQLCNSL